MEINNQRRSIHVFLEDLDFHLDVVPALLQEEPDDVLLIPDRRQDRWIKSQPIGYAKMFASLNEEHGNKVRSLVKLLKHFRDCHMTNRRPKSYWLEAMVVDLIRKDAVATGNALAFVFRDLLGAIQTRFSSTLHRNDNSTPLIPDPMLGHNVATGWERSHFETFMRRIDEGRRAADQALEADTSDEAALFWQQVFDEEHFPSQATATVAVAQSILPGSAYVMPSGRVTRDKTGPSIRSRPTKYYGTT